MHQQVRTSTKKTGSGSAGPGAMEAEGGLVDILEILLRAGVNLRAAGGRDLDRGGEFVFAVHHGQDNDDRPGEEAAALLRDERYRARAVYVHHCLVNDEPGSLLRCIQETEATEGPVYEIFVGTANADGQIPLQITTRRGLGEEEQAAS
jgi:hypothetical protein